MTSWIDWDKTEEVLSRHARPFLGALYPPASSAELLALRRLGVHGSISESYARHDGSRRHGGLLAALPTSPLHPWTRVTRWQRVKNALSDTARLAPRIALPQGWLVLARFRRCEPGDDYADAAEYLIVVAADGTLCALDAQGTADLHPVSLAISWMDAVGLVTHSLSSATLLYGRQWEVDRLEAPFQTETPPKLPPASAGQSFLTLLVERGALVLGSPPSADLLGRLDKALRRRDREAAARDIAVALRGAAPGAKFALSEAQLVAVLALF